MLDFIKNEKFYLPVAYLLLGIIIYNIIRVLINKISKNKHIDKKKRTIISLIKNIIKYLILIIVALSILSIYGVNTSGILASIGVIGVIIGLALQDLIADFLAGLSIIFDNKYIYDFLKFLITYIWYPPYLLFVTTILFSIINFIYTMFKKLSSKRKIINYLLFCLNFSCYITFLRLNIDLNSYTSYYANNSLTVLRITSISLLVWLILSIIFILIDRSKNEK